MPWRVLFHDAFRADYDAWPEEVQDGLMKTVRLLMASGPHLGRPHVDTLKASRFPNLKELRFSADRGVWRMAFIFDPTRKAILLVGGNKSGGGEGRFYRTLIAMAESRYQSHLDNLAGTRKDPKPWP